MTDGIYVDVSGTKPVAIDIDETFEIGAIKEIIYDVEDQLFYICCNKYKGRLGFYVVSFNEKSTDSRTFLLKWKNKLDLGDANVHIMRDPVAKTKEAIFSFKTININTYNLMVMDLSKKAGVEACCKDSENKTIIFRHESFQLWESKINGILLNRNKEFITLNNEGINILGLGSNSKRPLVDNSGFKRMVHSLESCNHLKLAKSNFLLFSCAKYEDRQIMIQQEHQIKDKSSATEEYVETGFDKIYNIKIWEVTLRELLLF